MADLEYPDVMHEVKGAMALGRFKLSEQNIIFKNLKTGKVDHISASDIDVINWQKFVNYCGLRIFLKNGTLHRYHGFKEGEQEKISKFITSNYKKDLTEKEMSVKGWNWGTAKFSGSLLSFDVGNHTAFEIPLNYVSQCTTGKNEVTVEFHQNDDAPVSLMEMRFHIPSSELAGEDPVESFHQNVMNKASVINVSGDALAIFREIHCANPRGRYDIKVYSSFFQLHGKTFDYKIPAHTVLRLFLLPHYDKRQIYFVISLDPPIKQGQTRYHYLVCIFPQEDDEITIELPYSDEELKTKYEGKLEKEMKGQTFEVLGKLMKAIVGRKLTMPSYVGKSETPAIACSYKASSGHIYPLERGFMYLRKPPFYIRFEEIISVNFARRGGTNRSFDFEVETKMGTIHTFSSIEKEEYGKLFDFIASKKLTVKNRGGKDKPIYTDDLVDSDQEEPDAYLARVKREAEERDDDGGSGEESTDEDFNPNQEESDVAEEYDSNAPDSTDSEDGSIGSGGGKTEKKEKKPKKAKTISEKPRKKKEKKVKDANAPKRPQSAYFIWMNENRDKIKEKNPGISVAEIAKKAGEMWRELKDKAEWDEKAKKAKSDYEVAIQEYKASMGGEESKAGGKKSNKSVISKSSPSKAMSGSGFKSKEYLSDTGSSSGEDGEKKPAKKGKNKASDAKSKKEPAKAKKASSEDEDIASSEEESKSKKTNKKEPAKAKKSSSEDEADASSEEENKSKKTKKKEPAKAKKASSEDEIDASSEEENKSKKRKKEDSDKEGKGKKQKKPEKPDVDEEDDEFPEEPDESTPATTSDDGNSSGSD